MGYMTGVSQRGLEFVAKVTKMLNSLKEEDYEDTYVGLRVELVEDGGTTILGYWSEEHGPGGWAYFDGEPHYDKNTKPLVVNLSVDSIRDVVANTPTSLTLTIADCERIAQSVMELAVGQIRKDKGS
jgi:hypothetical protein